jgi:hypothetical protein
MNLSEVLASKHRCVDVLVVTKTAFAVFLSFCCQVNRSFKAIENILAEESL